MKTYRADVTRDGQWWMVSIPELGGLTQARHLGEADQMAREWIAVTLQVPIDEVEVDLVVRRVGGVEVGDMVVQIKKDREVAAEASSRATEQSRLLARQLAKKGVTVRDIGKILGMSHQRAHQLLEGPRNPAKQAGVKRPSVGRRAARS